MSDSTKQEKDEYILGTHHDELWRLGYQHQVWAEETYRGWRTAGFTKDQVILDLGCGPGFATRDLGYLVGPEGRVIGIDRSAHFIAFLDQVTKLHRLPIESWLTDFDDVSFEHQDLDGVFCRWALAWYDKPQEIVQKVAKSMKPGATFVSHEYFNWKTFQFKPYSKSLKVSLEAILDSFSDAGGDIDIGQHMPELFINAGLEVIETRPLSKIGIPGNLTWNWPKTFLHIYLPRVVELGFLDESTMEEALDDWKSMESTNGAFVFTPQMIEVIGRK